MLDARPMTAAATDTDTERTDARALTMPLVAAQIAQNVAGGLLLGNAVAALLWLAGADLTQVWRWPVGIGWFIAGAAGVRAFIDEFRADRRWRKREREHRAEMSLIVYKCDRLEAERNAAKADAQIARSESDRLRNEYFEARAQLQIERHDNNPKRLGRTMMYSAETQRDAAALMKLWYEKELWPGEGAMGWSRERQKAARELLQDAEIAPHKVYSNLAPTGDYAWAEAQFFAYFAKKPSRDASTT